MNGIAAEAGGPQSRSSNGRTPTALELLGKSVPVFAVLLYVTGYLIRTAYFRSINVHYIDFFKAECFETGAYFCVLSLGVLSLILLPALIIQMWRERDSLIPDDWNWQGATMSTLAVLGVFGTLLVTVVFYRPQDIAAVHIHLSQMIRTAVLFSIFLIGTTILQRKLAQREKSGESLPVTSRGAGALGAFLRFAFMCVVAYQVYYVMFRDVHDPPTVFRDEYCLPYLIFLGLFAAAAFRLYSTLGANGETSQGNGRSLVRFGVPLSSLRVFLVIITYFLVITSYAFGPFLHVPTNKGGGRQYSMVEIELASGVDAGEYPFGVTGCKLTLPVYLLAESESWVYVVPRSGKTETPREAFRSMAKGKTYCIGRNDIESLVFERIP